MSRFLGGNKFTGTLTGGAVAVGDGMIDVDDWYETRTVNDTKTMIYRTNNRTGKVENRIVNTSGKLLWKVIGIGKGTGKNE